MGTNTFFVPPEHWHEEICVDGQEARHISQVLHLKPHDAVQVLDGRGNIGYCSVRSVSKNRVMLELHDKKFFPRPASLPIMALAHSKNGRRGFFFEKAVELGAHAIWIWQAEFSQGKLNDSIESSCMGKLIAGAKQCANPWLPEICALHGGIAELVEKSSMADFKILPWEKQENVPLLTPGLLGRPGLTIYVIGPEGGFSPNEVAALEHAKFTPVSFGSRVLRCETAATLCLGLHWWASHASGGFEQCP